MVELRPFKAIAPVQLRVGSYEQMKKCANCEVVLEGRGQKKFCTRSCAASFNNRISPKRMKEGSCDKCGVSVSSRRKYCEKCLPEIVRSRASKEDVRSYQRAYYKRRYEKRKKLAFEILGAACTQCDREADLEIDHLDPKKKKFTLTTAYSLPLNLFVDELRKCQVLCSKCHKEKTSGEQRTKFHGTWGMYKRGCRCPSCREFVSAYHKEKYRSRPQ